MTSIVTDALYGFAAKFVLIFVLAPAGIILAGNLIYIVVESVKELRRSNGKRENNEKGEKT